VTTDDVQRDAGADPLLSVIDVARRWQVDQNTVAGLVADQQIDSLDGGEIVRHGRFDVPCLRASWAEQVRVDSPGAVRRIDQEYAHEAHPAAQIGFRFQIAVQGRDVETVWQLSTEGSREMAGSPDALLNRWIDALGPAAGPNTSFTTGVYRLTPYPGVGARIMIGTLPMALRVSMPTPMTLAGIIPLIEDDGEWRANLAVAELDVSWGPLLASAPPEPPADSVS
jgi:hypothetical protein